MTNGMEKAGSGKRTGKKTGAKTRTAARAGNGKNPGRKTGVEIRPRMTSGGAAGKRLAAAKRDTRRRTKTAPL